MRASHFTGSWTSKVVMGISKIDRLFVSNTDAILQKSSSQVSGASNQSQRSAASALETKSPTPDDAVIFSRTIRTAAGLRAAELAQARTDRVQQLRERVRNGSYSIESDKVAVAVMKDLL
jgi:anti-sigma28 factor (negative regulator of flagellin synthesis)